MSTLLMQITDDAIKTDGHKHKGATKISIKEAQTETNAHVYCRKEHKLGVFLLWKHNVFANKVWECCISLF